MVAIIDAAIERSVEIGAAAAAGGFGGFVDNDVLASLGERARGGEAS
jgi:hypothetical protein